MSPYDRPRALSSILTILIFDMRELDSVAIVRHCLLILFSRNPTCDREADRETQTHDDSI